MNASVEQQQIIDAIVNGHNVFTDAVAGSGKTTTIKFIGMACPHLSILVLTYNTRLKDEVRAKLSEQFEVHTYHSLAVKHLHPSACDDENLAYLLSTIPIKPVKFDLLIIDETQDMIPLYYRLVRLLLSPSQILVMGDKNQGLYAFKGADPRFLTLAPKLFESTHSLETTETPPKIKTLTLSHSYRITDSIGYFVNHVMLKQERMQTSKPGPPVEYIIDDPYTAAPFIHKRLIKLLETYTPEDIFILAPSIKNRSPISMLENLLVESGVPCYTGYNQDTDSDIVKGKVVFTTFHQSKGRERKIVIIYGFDESYFKYYDRSADPTQCPPTLYVAATRASELLILIHGNQSSRLPFLDPYSLQNSPHIVFPRVVLPSIERSISPPTPTYKKIVVTEITKFLNPDILLTLRSVVANVFRTIDPPGEIINIPSKISSAIHDNQFEYISDITAQAIIFRWEHHHRNSINAYNAILRSRYPTKIAMNILGEVELECMTNASYLRIANIHQAMVTGYHNSLVQIRNYDWLSEDITDQCVSRIQAKIKHDHEGRIEVGRTLCTPGLDHVAITSGSHGELHFYGRVGVSTSTDIWEIKCVSALTLEHHLQVIFYAFMWDLMHEGRNPRRFHLLNIKTGEHVMIESSFKQLTEIVLTVVEHQFNQHTTSSDEHFLSDLKNTV